MEANTSRKRSPVLEYALVFILLAVITAVEIGLSSPGFGLSRGLLTPLFVLFALAKAGFVAAFFMHLRQDSRLYLYIFLLPAVMLLMFAYLMVTT